MKIKELKGQKPQPAETKLVEKLKGKELTKLTAKEKDELLLLMAKDLGYIQ